MNCCSSQCTKGIDKFFSKEASRFLKRYKKKGLEKSQKNLMAGIEKAGFHKKSLLEIGCGVGYFHAQLLEKGALKATGIDISHEMIRFAQNYMKEAGYEEKTHYHTGDFVELYPELEAADITILDKVICCYPDAGELVEKSISKTRKAYAFTLPREKWWVKYPVKGVIALFKLFRFSFHPYFHGHEEIQKSLAAKKFKKVYQGHDFFWETYVFAK